MTTLKILPAALDIEIFRGVTFDVTYTIRPKNADGSKGPPVDFTGYSGVMNIFNSDFAAAPEDVISTANGRMILGGPAGTIRVMAPAAGVQAYTFERGLHTVEVTDGSGVVTPLLAGLFKVLRKL